MTASSQRSRTSSGPAAARRLRLPAVALVAVGVLAGTSACTSKAGAAAVVGGDRIGIGTLHGITVRGTNSAALQAYSGAEGLQRRELTLLVRRSLLARLADRLGVRITDQQAGAVGQSFVSQAGGQAAFEQQVAQSGIGAQDLPAAVRDEALRQAVVAKLSSNQTQGETLYAQQLQKESKLARVTISPRFGAWDASALEVVASSDSLSSPSKSSAASDLSLTGQ